MLHSFEKIHSHSFVNQGVFKLKVLLLCIKRAGQNLFSGIKKFPVNDFLLQAPIIAESSSELWNKDDQPDNWILTAGKVENLRVARSYLHEIVIPAGKVFSFWQHLGYPSQQKGYRLGREIREGCIVPTIAGGLCQLSNALYDAALKANFEILERHKHSKVVQGSLAEKDRDATVKWNYLDLKFRASQDFRIEIELTTAQLILRLKSWGAPGAQKIPIAEIIQTPHTLLDCLSCGETDCDSHPKNIEKIRKINSTAYVLDEASKEIKNYLTARISPEDALLTPFGVGNSFVPLRYRWNNFPVKQSASVWMKAAMRSIALRWAAKSGGNVFSAAIKQDKKIAQALAKKIPIEATHLVISQNLLPFIGEMGVLGGRTYDVIMSRLPFDALQARLDLAQQKYPESKTLNDFRVDQELADAEKNALAAAQKVVTAHSEIAARFQSKAILVDWFTPTSAPIETKRFAEKVILFPASTLGRKGVYEVRQLAKELNLLVLLKGPVLEDPNFWQGVAVKPAPENIFEAAAVVVYPAYVEHQPRFLLAALAHGVAVVATHACGIAPRKNLTLVTAGDYTALKQAVIQVLALDSEQIHKSSLKKTS